MRAKQIRVALVVAVVACLPTAAPAAQDQGAAAPPPPATLTRQEAAALAVEIAPLVEEIRGARFKHPVPVEIVDDAGARKHFQGRMERYWPATQMHAEEIVYAQLGLLPPKSDLAGTVYDVLEEQASGFYDPDRDTFFVLGDMPRSIAPIITAHELTHALDDQYFGIDTLLAKTGDDSDRAGALDAVVEGSGTAVMSVFIVRQIQAGKLDPHALVEFQHSEAGQAARLKATPLFVQRSLLAPYILGMAFLLRGEMVRMKTGGINPADIRTAARAPDFLEGVLDYVAGNEALLCAVAAHAGVAPDELDRARQALSGGDWQRDVP